MATVLPERLFNVECPTGITFTDHLKALYFSVARLAEDCPTATTFKITPIFRAYCDSWFEQDVVTLLAILGGATWRERINVQVDPLARGAEGLMQDSDGVTVGVLRLANVW